MGRAKTGKTTKIREYIKEDIENKRKAILLVPEQYTLKSEQELINKNGYKGIMDLIVVSFTKLSDILRNKYRGKNRSIIDEVGLYILTSKIAEECRNELEIFKTSYRKNGFLEEINRLIQSFKKNCIEPEDIELYLKDKEEDIHIRKLREVNKIYKKMNEYMKDKYMDQNDILNLLSENILESDYLEKKNVYIDGFDVFSGREYEVLEAIISKADNIVISLNLDDDEFIEDISLFNPIKTSFRKIEDMSLKILGESVKIERLDENNIKDKYLRHLERNLFAYPAKKLKGRPNSISINSYLNPNDEVENIAIEIIKLVMEKKARWRDILVVSNDMNLYQSSIKRIFSEYEIPYFLDEKRDISSHNLVIYIIDLLRAINRNFKYQDVFKFLKTGLSSLDSEEVDILENYVLQFNIEGDKYFKEFEKGLDEYPEIEEIRVKFIENIEPLKSSFDGKKSIREINEKIFNYLTELDIKMKIDALMDRQIEIENFDIANETAQVWNILMDILDQMTELMGDLNIDISEYINLIESGLSNYKTGIIPPTLDQVIFGNLDRTKTGDIEYLFVIGVNDGILPSNLEDAGMLLDRDKEKLKEEGLDLNIDTNMVIESENFKIYSSFTKPNKKLFISYSISSHSGSSLRASTIIDRFKYIFPDLKTESHIGISEKTELEKIVSKRPSIKYISESFRQYLEGKDIDEEWINIYAWHIKRGDIDGFKSIIEGLFFINQQEYIEEKYSKKLYNLPLRTSVSRIEKFNSCPFMHFMTYGLYPRERKRCVIEYPDIGNILHTTLEEYGKRLKIENRRWEDIDERELNELTEEIIEKNIGKSEYFVFNSTARYRYLINKLKRVSKKSIRKATEQIDLGEFNPIEYELKFEEKIPTIELSFKDGTNLILEGKIDRLDICRLEDKTLFRVIDYKSGNQDFDISKALQGLQIQLIVYLKAVLDSDIDTEFRFEETELYPAGAFYFKMRDPIIRAENIDEAEKIRNKVEKVSGIIIDDKDIVKSLDRKMDRESRLYNIRMNKNGSIRKQNDILEIEEIQILIDHIEDIIKKTGEEIGRGNVKIEPYISESGQEKPCTYCDYSSICKFDINFEGNEYRKLKKMDIKSLKEKDSDDNA